MIRNELKLNSRPGLMSNRLRFWERIYAVALDVELVGVKFRFFSRTEEGNDCESTSVSLLPLYTTARSAGPAAGKAPFGGGASGIKEIFFPVLFLFVFSYFFSPLLFRLLHCRRFLLPFLLRFFRCCGRQDTQIEVGGDRSQQSH